MKKNIVLIVGVATIAFLVVTYSSSFTTITVENTKPETIVKTERVDNLEVLIKEAQEEARGGIESSAETTKENEIAAAKAEYEAKVTAAEAKHDTFIVNELTKVSDKVKEDYIAEIEATISSESY